MFSLSGFMHLSFLGWDLCFLRPFLPVATFPLPVADYETRYILGTPTSGIASSPGSPSSFTSPEMLLISCVIQKIEKELNMSGFFFKK